MLRPDENIQKLEAFCSARNLYLLIIEGLAIEEKTKKILSNPDVFGTNKPYVFFFFCFSLGFHL